MMNYKKGDLFIGKSEGNSSVIVVAVEDARKECYNETLCLYLSFPAAPEKVGTTDVFSHLALSRYYHKVE
jgi:hypothetical protein